MEHLALEIFDIATKQNPNPTGSGYANLPEDTSITINDSSDVFAGGDVWSYSFTLNVRANAHILGTAGEMHGSRLHDQLNKRRARLWVEGEPMYLGYLKLEDEADVDADGNVEVSFESGQKTFDDLIEGGKANQVPLMNDIRIGVALWRKRKVSFGIRMTGAIVWKDIEEPLFGNSTSTTGDVETSSGSKVITFGADGEDENTSVQEYPRMVFPRGTFENKETGQDEDVNCLNTDRPYDEDEDGTPTHPYCNVTLCYQRQGYEKKNEKGELIPDYNSEPEAQRGYDVMPADRVNSAPNFYVIYWIRALMKHLGIHVDENQMLGVQDLRRLFFVNTNCAYKEPKKLRTGSTGTGISAYRFSSEYSVPRRLVGEFTGFEEKDGLNFFYDRQSCFSLEGSGFTVTPKRIVTDFPLPESELMKRIERVSVDVTQVEKWSYNERRQYIMDNCYLHDAIATPECFPNVDISEVIKAVESGFGVRFLFSGDYKRVRIVLLRNIFRSTDIQDIACDVVKQGKTDSATRGFRMTYGDSDDTTFYYKGFNDMLPHMKELWPDTTDKHDYSQWDLSAVYADIMHRVSAFNKTCYVTPVNGNAYGIKIDKDAKRYEELHPSLFEYAGYMDAEDGDCSGEENTIETVTVGFKPAITNDTAWENERKNQTQDQRFALFVDETMRPRRPELKDGVDYNDPTAYYDVDGELYGKDDDGEDKYPGMRSEDGIVKPGEFAVTSDLFGSKTSLKLKVKLIKLLGESGVFDATVTMDVDGHISEGYRLYLQDNYEPSDTGTSPVETHDWGLTLGIMRGSGEDAGVKYDMDPDDQEGNDTWELQPGSNVTSHPDMCDNYGKEWDYNGTGEDIGSREGRISLKLRAEKPNPYFDPKQEESDMNRRYLQIDTPSLRGRGLADQFYKEYSYWVRNAHVANLTVRMELAQLLAIDKTKRVRIGDVTGFIRKMQYTVSKQGGLGMVTMEIMYI